MIDALRLAWIAGLLEGEGSFTVQQPKSGGYRLSIRCGMTDHDVVRRLAEWTGVGRLYGPYERWSNGRQPMLVWAVVRRSDVVPLARALRPLMGERRQSDIDRMLATDREHPLRTWSHGKTSSYKRHGCRCDACREAFKAEQRRLWARRVAMGLPGRGTVEYHERRKAKAREKHARRRAAEAA